MKVKTYKTLSLQEGLENIKRDLGNDALILSTRPITARAPFALFKKPGWEITAALDEKLVSNPEPSPATAPALLPVEEAAAKQRVRVSNPTLASSAATAAAPARIVKKDPAIDELVGEIAELKKSVRSLTKLIPAKSDSGGVLGEMIAQGIERDLANHLIATASQGDPAGSELRERVSRLLADQLTIAAPAELYAKTPVVSVFVGPTGVGKTTTIAKIAGHAALRMKKKVALISTDLFRVGGHEQLSRLGELLGVPTYSCADITTLKHLVASIDDRNLILIDTAGSSPSDLTRLSRLETVAKEADAKVHLVISATTRSEDIATIVSRFQRFSPSSVIFTKIDETDCKGALTADLLRHELALSYLTNGQRIPEDLLVPGADELARYVLPVESLL